MAVLGAFTLSPLNAADFQCDFYFETNSITKERYQYTCSNPESLPESDFTITNVIGEHKYQNEDNTVLYTNDDVDRLELSGNKIPNGLSTWFPKLTKLLTEKLIQISRSDLSDFKQLKKLAISVRFLPANIFDDLENLQILELRDSINIFPPMVFHKLLQLEIVEVNTGFMKGKMKELPADLFQNNLNLKEISFHYNGLTCIRDGLLDGLNKLTKVSFIECITENYPNVALSVLKDKIHDNCQKCDVTSPVPEILPQLPSPGAPGANLPPPGFENFETEDLLFVPSITGIPENSLSLSSTGDMPNTPQPSPAALPWIPLTDSNSCTRELNQLQSDYNKLKVQKDCKQNVELIFKHTQH